MLGERRRDELANVGFVIDDEREMLVQFARARCLHCAEVRQQRETKEICNHRDAARKNANS
jgi:hypothetical protein